MLQKINDKFCNTWVGFLITKGFMRPQQEGDLERLFWNQVPCKLRGKSVSFDELKKLFPQGNEFSVIGEVDLKKGYSDLIYGRKYVLSGGRLGGLQLLAYTCRGCRQIIVGPPRIEPYGSEQDFRLLAGERGYKVYCSHCDTLLENHKTKIS